MADPAGTNGWHLNSPLQARSNADLACKIQVLSTRRVEIIKEYLPGQKADPSRMLARSKVLSVIKGECKPAIDIEFNDPKRRTLGLVLGPGMGDTELTQGEVCVVFVKREEGRYVLNRIRSKLRVTPKVVDYNLGDTPELRLLAEMLAGCDCEDEMVQLQAVEELGYLGKAMFRELRPFKGDKESFKRIAFGLGRAKEAVRRMRRCEDQVVRNISIISSFWLDDSPGIEGPLELLRTNPSDFDRDDSLKKYGTWDFCVSDLQLRLLETMDAATRRAVVDLGDGSVIRRKDGNPGVYRGVRGFDYTEFYRQALDCEAVRKNEQMRSAIANVIWIRYEKRSVPLMIELLDDPAAHIRSTAVSALRKCINSDMSNSWERRHFHDPNAAREYIRAGFEKKLEDRQKDYRDNEREYILYWKKWWRKHKNEFEILGENNSGTD
ncbi:MAG: HEAT repeat domain-containing protein [Planctomycetota bacterium]